MCRQHGARAPHLASSRRKASSSATFYVNASCLAPPPELAVSRHGGKTTVQRQGLVDVAARQLAGLTQQIMFLQPGGRRGKEASPGSPQELGGKPW